MKKSLTIEDLKNRVGKPVFIASQIYLETTKWNVIKEIAARQDLLYKYLEFIDGLTITFENANDFRFFDTEVSEEELKEILKEEKKAKKKTGYERVREGEKYWNIRGGSFLDDDNFFNVLYLHGDYINNEKLAGNIARAEKLRYQLRRYAALNGGISSQKDWQNQRCNKYFVYYDYGDNKIDVCNLSISRDFGQIYFKDIKACKKAIEIFKDELIWYFTEFQEMLY